jgi:hypothetical protein
VPLLARSLMCHPYPFLAFRPSFLPSFLRLVIITSMYLAFSKSRHNACQLVSKRETMKSSRIAVERADTTTFNINPLCLSLSSESFRLWIKKFIFPDSTRTAAVAFGCCTSGQANTAKRALKVHIRIAACRQALQGSRQVRLSSTFEES